MQPLSSDIWSCTSSNWGQVWVTSTVFDNNSQVHTQQRHCSGWQSVTCHRPDRAPAVGESSLCELSVMLRSRLNGLFWPFTNCDVILWLIYTVRKVALRDAVYSLKKLVFLQVVLRWEPFMDPLLLWLLVIGKASSCCMTDIISLKPATDKASFNHDATPYLEASQVLSAPLRLRVQNRESHKEPM